MTITPTEDRRAIHLTDDQIATIKSALQTVQAAYRGQGGERQPEVDTLIDDAYRAMSVELIQRIPSPGDQWRGLTDGELEDIARALLSYESHQRKNGKGTVEDTHRQFILVRSASKEMDRRNPGWLDELERRSQ